MFRELESCFNKKNKTVTSMEDIRIETSSIPRIVTIIIVFVSTIVHIVSLTRKCRPLSAANRLLACYSITSLCRSMIQSISMAVITSEECFIGSFAVVLDLFLQTNGVLLFLIISGYHCLSVLSPTHQVTQGNIREIMIIAIVSSFLFHIEMFLIFNKALTTSEVIAFNIFLADFSLVTGVVILTVNMFSYRATRKIGKNNNNDVNNTSSNKPLPGRLDSKKSLPERQENSEINRIQQGSWCAMDNGTKKSNTLQPYYYKVQGNSTSNEKFNIQTNTEQNASPHQSSAQDNYSKNNVMNNSIMNLLIASICNIVMTLPLVIARFKADLVPGLRVVQKSHEIEETIAFLFCGLLPLLCVTQILNRKDSIVL